MPLDGSELESAADSIRTQTASAPGSVLLPSAQNISSRRNQRMSG